MQHRVKNQSQPLIDETTDTSYMVSQLIIKKKNQAGYFKSGKVIERPLKHDAPSRRQQKKKGSQTKGAMKVNWFLAWSWADAYKPRVAKIPTAAGQDLFVLINYHDHWFFAFFESNSMCILATWVDHLAIHSRSWRCGVTCVEMVTVYFKQTIPPPRSVYSPWDLTHTREVNFKTK